MNRLPPLTQRTRNLVRFARHLPVETMHESFAGDFAFRDAGSRFSVLKSPHTAPGPDECFGLFARDVRPLFQKLLGLELTYEGLDASRQAKLAGYNAMNYYRSHVEEHFCHNGLEPKPPIAGVCTFWFGAADVLCVRYELVNRSATDVPVQLAWTAQGAAGDDCRAEPAPEGFRFRNTQSVGPVRYVSRAELRAEDADVQFALTPGATSLSSTPVSREVPAHGRLTSRFAVRFAVNEDAFPDWPEDVWRDTGLDRAIDAAETAYARLPALSETLRCHHDLTLKAAGTLRSLRYLDLGADGEPVMTIHAGKTGCGCTWFWDTALTLPGLGVLNEREAAAGALRLLTGGIKPDGVPPVTYEAREHRAYGYQNPILAWGAGHYLAACPDRQLLADVYAPLARYVRRWMTRCDNAWGLIVPDDACGCLGLDDGLRWHSGSPLEPAPGQPWHEQEWGSMSPWLFAAPDVNAFIVLELRSLAEMARALGKPEDGASWDVQADGLAAALNEHLIDPITGTFQDRNVETGEFTGMVQMGSFLPVYAGIAPRDIAEHMCRDYLLSPDHFLTDMPFPVVDRAHPTFRPGGFLYQPPSHPGSLVQHSYWRGRTWIHADNWYLGALWGSGFELEADELADRILTAVSRTEGINEVYDSLTGFGNGHPEFMWSSAAVLMMAHGFYRVAPVASLASAL